VVIACKILVTIWYVLSKQEAYRYASEENLAYKMLTCAPKGYLVMEHGQGSAPGNDAAAVRQVWFVLLHKSISEEGHLLYPFFTTLRKPYLWVITGSPGLIFVLYYY
jgi:hypothetical protein